MKDCPEIVPYVQDSESLMYFPDKVIRKDNGMLLIKPSNDYFKISDNWKNCCMGVFHNEAPTNLNLIKNDLLQSYRRIGLVDVFSHPLGFLVLKFNSQQTVYNVINCSPLSINGQKIHVHKWWERYQTNYPLAKEKVWIEISNIPFSYWSVEGLCLITSAIGKPICFDKRTFMNATKKSPSDKALIYVEILMGAARPGVIMTSLPGHADKNMAMVNVAYLQTLRNCLMCLSLDHTTNNCVYVRELVPGTYNPNRNGRNLLEFVTDYFSNSEEDSTTGDLKKSKSIENHEKLVTTSMSLTHTTVGTGHDDRVHDSVFQVISNTDGAGNDLATTSHKQQVQPIETHPECHNIERVVDEAPPQETVIEQLASRGTKRGRRRPRTKSLKQVEENCLQNLSISHDRDVETHPECHNIERVVDEAPPQETVIEPLASRGTKRGRGRPRTKSLKQVEENYLQNLSISHDRDVTAAQESINAPFKSVNHVRGRPRKNQGTNISTPQELVVTSKVTLKSTKRGRGRPRKKPLEHVGGSYVLTKGAYMLLYARCSPRAPKLIRNVMVPRDPRKPKNISLLSRSNSTGACDSPRTDHLNYQSGEGFYRDHPGFRRVFSTPDDDSSSDNSSSLFSEACSCSTESSTKDSTSTDDYFDQIFGESGHNSWWNSSDSDTSSSSSPSPLYSKNMHCNSLDHFATRYNKGSHYSADCVEYAEDGHVWAKQPSNCSNVEILKGKGSVPVLYSDKGKHCRKLDRNSNCSSCRETNLDKVGKLNPLNSVKSGTSLRKSSRGKPDKD